MKVSVYRNLKSGKWSVVVGRRVADQARWLYVQDARFVVQPGGRERVVREQKKYVHAFVRGDRAGWRDMPEDVIRVTYNPYAAPTFVRLDTGAPVVGAARVWLYEGGKVFVRGVEDA